MKITAGILFYLLDVHDKMQHICHGADRMELTRTEYLHNQQQTEQGVLYIYAAEKAVYLFCSEKKQELPYILQWMQKISDKTNETLKKEVAFNDTALKKEVAFIDGAFSMFRITYDDSDGDTLTGLSSAADSDGRTLPRLSSADEVTEHIVRTWNNFSQIQNEILEAILSQEKIETIMDKGRGLLKEPFTLVNRDMLLLYEHPEIPKTMTVEVGEDYPEEIVENLLMTKEFHEAAGKREPFYYSMENLGRQLYCVNIAADDYYYARLVVYVDKGKQTLPSGAEQITEYLSGVAIRMIRQGILRMTKSQKDLLHMILQRLLEGYAPETTEVSRAVTEYHWKENHTYQAVCLEPYAASGWEMQVENTMPAIIRKLEQAFSHSCAVFFGKKILWILNWTLSVNEGKPYELSQLLMMLLRENVLRAGASSNFNDIRLISSAMKEAEAALETGTRKEPSYWFYRFDDYRLSFMIDIIRAKDIDLMLLVHPAIPVLMRHDKTHDSELSKTLETLIEKRGNVTQAAESLFIHRTTLFRRLHIIRELTGIDPDDVDQMLELQLSYRMLK